MNDPRLHAIETKVREYFKDQGVDSFYTKVWGGEDIHIGIYDTNDVPIPSASRRTVSQMVSMIADQKPGAKVLDLGAGYGGTARYLAKEH